MSSEEDYEEVNKEEIELEQKNEGISMSRKIVYFGVAFAILMGIILGFTTAAWIAIITSITSVIGSIIAGFLLHYSGNTKSPGDIKREKKIDIGTSKKHVIEEDIPEYKKEMASSISNSQDDDLRQLLNSLKDDTAIKKEFNMPSSNVLEESSSGNNIPDKNYDIDALLKELSLENTEKKDQKKDINHENISALNMNNDVVKNFSLGQEKHP